MMRGELSGVDQSSDKRLGRDLMVQTAGVTANEKMEEDAECQGSNRSRCASDLRRSGGSCSYLQRNLAW